LYQNGQCVTILSVMRQHRFVVLRAKATHTESHKKGEQILWAQ